MAQDAMPPKGAPSTDIDPFTPERILDPYAWHAELRDLGPMVWLNKYSCYFAPRYAEAFAIAGDPLTFCSSAGVGYTNFRKGKPWRPPSLLLEADPPDHTRRRAIVGRILSAPNLRGFRAGFEVEANKLIDKLLDKGEVEAVSEAAQAYVLKVFPDAVGIGPDNRFNLVKYGAMVFNAFGPQNEIFDQSACDLEEVGPWIMKGCLRENLEPGKLGDQVYQAVAGGQITEEEAPILVRSFLSAGVDTTIDAVGNAMWCFAMHPAEWAKVKANPGIVKTAFEEVLRYESPFQSFFRTTTRDVEIAGVTIPDNEKVMLNTASANRDPRKWDRADVFDVSRDVRGHVGLGYGIHACIGQMISRLENEVLLTELAKRNVNFEVTGATQYKVHNTLRGFASLPMRFSAG
jgi:4-methoxybenzoate monooxygenase (O-demethylating)